MIEHPLFVLFKYYIDSFKYLKSTHLDLANLDYNQAYSLYVSGPSDWPYPEIVGNIVEYSKKHMDGPFKVEIIYSSTSMYDTVSKKIPQSDVVSYLSWQEIFYAIHTSSNDSRNMREIRSRMESSRLVIVVGVLHSQEVLDQIKAYTDGCLIVLG